MKWKDKGREIDIIQVHNLSEQRFYIFGAGDIGRGVWVTLNHYHMFAGFIDNDKKKQKEGFCGQKVYSYEWFLENDREKVIIVAANTANEKAICSQISDEKCRYYKAAEFLNKVLPVYLLSAKEELFMNLAQICVTERCTLRCKDCAHGCYAVSRSAEDMSLNDVKHSADSLFEKIDFIHEFVLIGGEPLLYKYLPQAVEYIGKKYRDKIGTFSITSNGTLIPNTDLINNCKKYDVFVRISNYINAVPNIGKQHMKIKEILQQEEIAYQIGKAEEEWWDYGFKDEFNQQEEEALIRRFDGCRTPCREIRKDRLYYCVMARTVSENFGYNIGKDDYLNLSDYNNDLIGKRIILEYNLGYSEKGYLEMCARCHGKDCMNYPVKAAVQLGDVNENA